jgi:isoaspartyl peptidase/L-asparaginase-like protein (Ntn-hydrolase superfamily)
MYALEKSGICNAGTGCNLTREGKGELEASFLELTDG